MTPAQTHMLQHLIAGTGGAALFRPSSASGWLACHGRVQLSAQAPRDTRRSDYATEGTAAHLVLNQALANERQPDEWTDRQVRIDDMTGWFVDEEMVDAVEWSADCVRALADEPGTEMFLEYPLTLGALDPDDPLLAQNRGTGDVVLVNRTKRWLKIIDLKYGKGIMVAGDSPQLLDYGLMGLVTFGVDGGWDSIESIVLQPRAALEHQRYKAITQDPNDLLINFLGRVGEAMEAALLPDPPLVTGEHCRWCPARPICPALRASALAISGDAFATNEALGMTIASQLTPIREMPSLPDPRALDAADIATILERRVAYDAWIDSIEQLAARMIESGVTIPGWTLKARTGNRRWIGEENDVVLALRGMGLSVGDVLTDPKLRSPAQVEKLLPKAKKGLIGPLVERPQGGLQLVRSPGDQSGQPIGSQSPNALSAIPVEAR